MSATDSILIRRVLIIIACVLFISVILSGIVKNVKASSEHDIIRDFHCDSIRIDDKDTLWGIAEEYFTDEYEDIDNYIKVIMRANSLQSTTIHKGNYLIIPYYR